MADYVMTTGVNALPSWDATGVMPPNNPDDPAGNARSPYVVSLLQLAATLGSSKPRQQLLLGLLDFRAALHGAALNQGFQWVDGSFVENIEETEDRPPNDIDVVTFFHIPDGLSQESLLQSFPGLFDPRQSKDSYGIDGYFVPLNQTTVENIIERTAYWYSLWSHTRAGLWKGFLQVGLHDSEDAAARATLEQIAAEEEQP